MKNIIYITILAIALVGCGSKKSVASKESVESITGSIVKQSVDVKENKNVSIVTNEDICEIELIPIDSAQPITIDGKKYSNARVLVRNKKLNRVYNSEENRTEQLEKQITNNKVIRTSRANKEVTKKNNILSYIWWIIGAMLLVLAYRIFRKFVLPIL